MQKNKPAYIIIFIMIVCLCCSLAVSLTAISLKDRQVANAELDRRKNVLLAAGIITPQDTVSKTEIDKYFENVRTSYLDLEKGVLTGSASPALKKAPDNTAGVTQIPEIAEIYQITNKNEQITQLILPIEGKGLWSTMYGFLALLPDTTTVSGITFYQHGETPGLGGEIDNPSWKALWRGRKVFDKNWQPALTVIKGNAASAEEDPYKIDGLSGATLTSRGVTNTIQFWMGDNGYGKFLENFREGEANK